MNEGLKWFKFTLLLYSTIEIEAVAHKVMYYYQDIGNIWSIK
jgi:hypothetical protein